jgi:hypothetical protein
MPYWAEVEKEGFEQLADPVVVGAVDAVGALDAVGVLEGAGAGPLDCVGLPDAARRLADADADFEARAARDLRDDGFGMIAIRGVAATCGMPIAAAL